MHELFAHILPSVLELPREFGSVTPKHWINEFVDILN